MKNGLQGESFCTPAQCYVFSFIVSIVYTMISPKFNSFLFPFFKLATALSEKAIHFYCNLEDFANITKYFKVYLIWDVVFAFMM